MKISGQINASTDKQLAYDPRYIANAIKDLLKAHFNLDVNVNLRIVRDQSAIKQATRNLTRHNYGKQQI